MVVLKNVFILGSKGIPAKYGGFETFVDELTKRRTSEQIFYHISCMGDNKSEFFYNNARCFNINVPNIGSARAVLYDLYSLKETVKYIKENNLTNSIVYVLACRIGPFVAHYKKILKEMNVKLYVNPDGHEWKRSKWNFFIRKYWKYSEKLMIKNADLIVCDSLGIETYIMNQYSNYEPKTTFIAYGADVTKSELDYSDKTLSTWYESNSIKLNNYYLIVGRFVPENNLECIIREFMLSTTNKDLVIISNVEKNKFFEELLNKTEFNRDKRVKFVGTVYDKELLKRIRELAYGYIHGHEVGGTNPSLLESLASTKLNLLLDVNFNKEVGLDGALYFNKLHQNLANLIEKTDKLEEYEIEEFAIKARNRINEVYSWDNIVSKYENLFLKN